MIREARREARFWRAYHANRYAILFYTLLLTLVIMPVASTFRWDVTAIETMLGLTLITAVMPLSTAKSRRLLLAGIILLLLVRPFATQIHQSTVAEGALGVWAIIGFFAAISAVRFVLKATKIDSEHIYAALSAYLLAGIFFGVSYWSIEQRWPDSFSGPSEFTREAANYFSFVTLASLGYGDFLPKTDMVRGMAVFEVVGGQLFLVVTVARLVSLYSAERASR
jgi:hypothetical protein